MPSKLEHEFIKVRGEAVKTKRVYTATMADLKEFLLAMEEDIKSLEDNKVDHTAKISQIQFKANRALSIAKRAIPYSDRAHYLASLVALLSSGLRVWSEDLSTSAYLAANTGYSTFPKVKTNQIDEMTNNAGVTIDGMLCKDGLIDGLDPSGIEAGATADQTDAEIKTAIENISNITLNDTIQFFGNQINKISGDTDNSPIYFNWSGYEGGLTRFRDFYIGNGKNSNIAFFDGSEKETTLYGNLITAHNVDGRDLSTDGTKLDTIDTNADVTGSNAPQAHGASVHTDRNRKFFVLPHHTDGSMSERGALLDGVGGAENAYFMFKLPNDYVSIAGLKLVFERTAAIGGDILWDVTLYGAEIGEIYTNHTNEDLNNVISIASGSIASFTLDHTTLFSSITINDFLYVIVYRDSADALDTYGADIKVLGLDIEYVADM